MKFPRDLLIFSPLMFRNSECIQTLTKRFPVSASDCAISFSWWGNLRSFPPVWMSKLGPRYLMAITEHSMCQPGLPFPSLVSQKTEPSSGSHAFQSAKSLAPIFS